MCNIVSGSLVVKLTSDGVVKRLLGEVASLVGSVEDLVVKNRKVQSEAKTDWMSWGKLSLSDVGGVLVQVKEDQHHSEGQSYVGPNVRTL